MPNHQITTLFPSHPPVNDPNGTMIPKQDVSKPKKKTKECKDQWNASSKRLWACFLRVNPNAVEILPATLVTSGNCTGKPGNDRVASCTCLKCMWKTLVNCLQDPLQNKKLIASAGTINPLWVGSTALKHLLMRAPADNIKVGPFPTSRVSLLLGKRDDFSPSIPPRQGSNTSKRVTTLSFACRS